MVFPTSISTAPSVYFTHPPASLLKYTPSANPEVMSPPVSDSTLARPFNIDAETYKNALHPAVPVTIAIIYASTVLYANRRNKERDYKPWAISKSFAFYCFVVYHNVFLAIYSGWTFVGMANAIRKSWPGLDGRYGLAGAADSLCKMHGPRGLGSAAAYNASSESGWGLTDRAFRLAEGRPDTTDVGRLWNEGLAFYGWLFYLSKFYEVVDTVIILLKGKKSSDLQTFHHAGAMLCMWAGIRYMSPPIWMFVFINSGLHALMYTYYTLSALTIQVPYSMKRTLTTLQITQIVFGASYALAHLFIAYDIPIERPYLYMHNLSTALPSTASTFSSAISSAIASATAAADLGSWLKKVALRAAGEEGLAENVRNYQGETFGIDAIHAADVEKAQQETRYRTEIGRVHCLDTSGEVFAILLNLIYLAPLLALFVRYFARSYISRAKSEPPKPSQQENIKKSSKDAVRDMEREIQDAMDADQAGTTEPPTEAKEKLEKAKSNAKQGASDLSDKAQKSAKDASANVQRVANDVGNRAKDIAGDYPAKAQNAANDLSAKAQQKGQDTKGAVKEDLQALQEKMKKMGGEGSAKAKSALSSKEKSNDDDNKSRNKSPAKKDVDVKEEDEKPETNGDARAYEAVPDEPKTEDEKKAEEEMQPKQG